MASSVDSDSYSDSDSHSHSPSDLGVATGKPSSAAEGGAGTSQPLSKRARKEGGDDALVQIEEGLVVTQSELLDQMKKLKRRFLKASRTGRIGKTPEDRKIFELSRELWGGGGGGGGVPTSSKNKGGPAAGPSKLPEEESEETDWARMSSLLKVYGMKVDEGILRGGMKMVDSSKVEEMKTRLRKFRVAEMQMEGYKMTLQHYVTKLFLDGYLAASKQL